MTTLAHTVLTTALAASAQSMAPPSNGPAARASAPHARTTRGVGARSASPRAPKGANHRIEVGTKDGLPSFDVRQLPINEQQRWMHGGLDPEVSAVALSLLRQFASTGRGPVARALSRSKGARAAAIRIVARIDALDATTRSRALGPGGKAPRLSGSVGHPASQGFVSVGTVTDTLPTQGIPVNGAYDLELAGVHVVTAQEEDEDELVVVAAYIVPNADKTFTRTTVGPAPTGGVLTLGQGAASQQALALHHGTGGGLLVSGVFEVEANDDPARAEFETMLGLAEALAKQIGSDPLTDLAAFVEYSAGMLSLSDPMRWPAGSVVETIIPSSGSDPAGLYTLYSTPTQTVQGIGYKLVHEHASGTGRYALLFDVPAPYVAGPNVRIHVKRIESLDGVDAGADQDDLRVGVMINGKYDNAGSSRVLPSDRDLHLEPWIVQRKMNEAVVRVWVQLSDSSPPPQSGYIEGWFDSIPCGDQQGWWSVGPCPNIETDIDLNPSTGGTSSHGPVHPAVTFEINVATGEISGDVSGQVGKKLVLQGNETPRGRVELVVDIEP